MLRSLTLLLEQEKHNLAPYALFSGESRGREHPEPEPLYRLPFAEDRERVLHSSAFRRLQHKTQVFLSNSGDYYRTRLTHTLEVAHVARSLSVALGLNENLSESIALCHDLGHPPFGHAGEKVLDALMQASGAGYFEHNLQTLRLVRHLAYRSTAYSGLNLTLEVLEGIAGHEASYNPLGQQNPSPSLEAQVADIADSMAYTTHDLDDGLRSGIVQPEQVAHLALWRLADQALDWGAVQRKTMTRAVLQALLHDVLTESAQRLEKGGEQMGIGFSVEMQQHLAELKTFLHQHFYQHPRVTSQMQRAEQVLEKLFSTYRIAPEHLPPEFAQRIAEDGLERVVCDYLSGMTDSFALAEYQRL